MVWCDLGLKPGLPNHWWTLSRHLIIIDSNHFHETTSSHVSLCVSSITSRHLIILDSHHFWETISSHVSLHVSSITSRHLILLEFHVCETISSYLSLCASGITSRHSITTERDGVNTVLGLVEFCWWLDPEEIPPESWTTCEYCPDVIWTTYLLDPFSQSFDIGHTYRGEFLGIILHPPT